MGGWQTKLTKEAEDDLRHLDPPIQNRVINKLFWLEKNCDLIKHETLSAKWHDYFKLRVGDWRIAYQLEHRPKLIVVYRIERRDKVYK